MTGDAITIDGSQGEGGGQILRTSLSLAAITGKTLTLHDIRAGRQKPGLLRQHLTGVQAIAAITGGQLEGAALGSRELVLRPGPVRPGDYHFAIGSAGSASLVLQTVLWPLLMAGGPSRVVVEGGTHNSMSPPFDFLARTFLPVLARMGARVELTLDRHGFYPAGGGRMVCAITPCAALQPLELLEAGPHLATRARALVANLPISIAHRELDTLRGKLVLSDAEPRSVIAMGPGNVVLIELEHTHVTEVVIGFGEKGKAAEVVARRAAKEATRYLELGAPVGEHLADQLIIPLALAGRGTFRTGPLSLHTRTNIDVVSAFLPVTFTLETDLEASLRINACRRSARSSSTAGTRAGPKARPAESPPPGGACNRHPHRTSGLDSCKSR